MKNACRCLLLLAAMIAFAVHAGEIPGIPSPLPPPIERDFEVTFLNDFLGRGGSTDDFRTQQLIVTGKIGERWMGLLDYSILTRDEPGSSARVDQLSGSLGFLLVDKASETRFSTVTIGGGFRSTGDYAGERMQNGFHRLVGSAVIGFPYTDDDRVDITAWVDASHYNLVREADSNSSFSGWSAGYWLRGSSLVTSDGQFDATASAFAVARRNNIDFWLGLRQDWRSGYRNDVLRTVAEEEEDLSVVFGMRFGALVLETVQQLNNDAPYGQLRMVSSGFRSRTDVEAAPRGAIDLGFVLPNVNLQASGRFRAGEESAFGWQRSWMFDARYGEPQHDDDPQYYLRTVQLTGGLDWERPVSRHAGWMSWYTNVGAGWRREQPLVVTATGASRGDPVDRGVLALGAGLRIRAADLGSAWQYRIQAGLTGWIPFSDARQTFAGKDFHFQTPSLGFQVGMTFDYQ